MMKHKKLFDTFIFFVVFTLQNSKSDYCKGKCYQRKAFEVVDGSRREALLGYRVGIHQRNCWKNTAARNTKDVCLVFQVLSKQTLRHFNLRSLEEEQIVKEQSEKLEMMLDKKQVLQVPYRTNLKKHDGLTTFTTSYICYCCHGVRLKSY